jgi:hypothetical protein
MPQKSSSSVWAWVLGLVAAGFLILGAGALLVTRYLVRRIEVSREAASVEITTPVGTLRAAKDETTDPGLPVYPGAKLSQPGGTVELTAPNEESVSLTSAHYLTTDPIEKVDAWYGEHVGTDFKREGPGVMIRKRDITGVVVKSGDIAYIADKEDFVRVVALQKKFNGVEIVLLRAGKPEAQ